MKQLQPGLSILDQKPLRYGQTRRNKGINMSEVDPIQNLINDFVEKVRAHAAERVHAVVDEVANRTRGTGGEVISIKSAKLKNGKAKNGKNGNGHAKAPAASADLESTKAMLLTAINDEPGRGISSISTQLGIPTKLLQPAVKLLLADKVIKTSGERRGTTYTATKAGAQAAA